MKRRPDGRYQKQITIGHKPDGKPVKAYIAGRTKQEMIDKEREIRRKMDRGVSAVSNKQTVEQYLTWWLEYLETIEETAPSTIEKYRQDFTNHVFTEIGHLPLVSCNPIMCSNFITGLKRRKSTKTQNYLSRRTMRNIRAALRAAFNHPAVKPFHPVNPWESTSLPKSLKEDDEFTPIQISPDMARALLGILSKSRYGLAFRYMMTMGFREGETLAIRKQDVNLEQETVQVTGSVRWRKGVGVKRGETKTPAAKAVLPLPPMLVALTRQHIDKQTPTEAASPWLFPTRNGTAVEATNLIRYFKTVCVTLGIAVIEKTDHKGTPYLSSALRVQDLRRFAGTQVAQEVDPKTAQKTLRHTNISTTYQYYIDAIPDEQRRALENIDRMLDEDRVIEIPRKRVEG